MNAIELTKLRNADITLINRLNALTDHYKILLANRQGEPPENPEVPT